MQAVSVPENDPPPLPLPEGNAAALYEGGVLLAIIPPWSGTNGFHGYARDSIGEGPVAWEIGTHNALIGRLHEAEEIGRAHV